jgi:hypothetical protein
VHRSFIWITNKRTHLPAFLKKLAYDIRSALLISSPNTSLYAPHRTIEVIMLKKILFTFLFATSVNAFNVQANAAFGKRSIISDTALKMSGGSVTATPDLKVGLFILLMIYTSYIILILSNYLQPPVALYEGAVAAGAAKASASWSKIFKLGVVSGAHIGFGSFLAITVGGACPGLAQANPGLQKVSCFYFMRSVTFDLSFCIFFNAYN